MIVDYVPVVIQVVSIVVHATWGPRYLRHRLPAVHVGIYVIVEIVSNLIGEEVVICVRSPLKESEDGDSEVSNPKISVILDVVVCIRN